MSDWIKIEGGQLPKEGEHVMVFENGCNYIASWEGHYWSEKMTGCGCCSGGIYPTHWMPLPPDPVI